MILKIIFCGLFIVAGLIAVYGTIDLFRQINKIKDDETKA